MSMKLNWLGIGVATVVAFFIGFLWYGLIFAEQWMALTGTVEDGGESPVWMLLGLLQTFVIMTGLGWLIGKTGDGWMNGLKTGLMAGVFFALTTSAYGFIYQTSAMGLLPIDWSHLLAVYGVGGAIIGGLKMPVKKA